MWPGPGATPAFGRCHEREHVCSRRMTLDSGINVMCPLRRRGRHQVFAICPLRRGIRWKALTAVIPGMMEEVPGILCQTSGGVNIWVVQEIICKNVPVLGRYEVIVLIS